MIIGIGIDIVSVSRIKNVLNRHDERFLAKFFPCEKGYDISPERVSGWFAAKEAFIKAVGMGMAITPMSRICIGYDDMGKPYIYGDIIPNGIKVHLSISHEKEMAIAVVILEGVNMP